MLGRITSERRRLFVGSGSKNEGGRSNVGGIRKGSQLHSELSTGSPAIGLSFFSFNRLGPEPSRIFEELPMATIVQVSRPDAADISPMQLSYVIEMQYKEFKWRLHRKAAQVLYLHFALKKRALMQEIHGKQEQVKEWLHNIRAVDSANVLPADGEADDYNVPLFPDDSAKNRDVPSSAAFPVLRPALSKQHSKSDRAKVAMQGYLNHFLGNLDIVNSRERGTMKLKPRFLWWQKVYTPSVAGQGSIFPFWSSLGKVCAFLEVSKLSFASEYGPKLREDYVMVNHLPKIPKDDDRTKWCNCNLFDWCSSNWQHVWAVLKPGFLALLEDPFDDNLLDIIVFDVLPPSVGNGEDLALLAEEVKDQNPLRHTFKVTCGNRNITVRTRSGSKVTDWVSSINDAGLRAPEGWCHSHRFVSFAPPRGLSDNCGKAQWFIDGEAAFEAIALAIQNAKSQIFICGWWVCPELYLRRPFHNHASSRFDALMEAKAKEGVQIYILLYKEVALALKINSIYSKRRLLDIHENVRVLRFPDHFSAGVYLWSHHEKIVIVDYQVCFIGGLDLCFGRYDTNDHKMVDSPPSIWPGKDYYNPRESEPNSWEDSMKDELDRNKYPRMPWHDVHCALWGPPCLDIARHFVQRWNHAKRSKAQNEQTIPLLMPKHHMVLPHYMGNDRDAEANADNLLEDKDMKRQHSFGSQSSLEDIPLLLPKVATRRCGDRLNGFDKAYNLNEEFASDMPIKGSAQERDDIDCWEMAERSDQVLPFTKTGQVGPFVSCRCQIIRSVSQWSVGAGQTEQSIQNAYCSLIDRAEHFIYIENQFFISGLSSDEAIQNRVLDALYRRIIRAYNDNAFFRVIVVLPLLPGFQGGVDDSGAASVRAIMHWQYRTICRGKHSIMHNLYALIGPKLHDYISFYGLRAHGELSQGGPVVTSQVYVHSKTMIVDDCIALIGSANINDRSLLGSRDSEIGVVIEDNEVIDSRMGGRPWKAGKFALSLRLSLWSEHLGLQAADLSRIYDPVTVSTYEDIWRATAENNTMIYKEVFACIPNDDVKSRVTLRQSMSQWKEKFGHTTIDLGVAPKKLEADHDGGDAKETDPSKRLQSLKGHLVLFPLEFMSREDLRPVFNESEYYASPQVFQ